MLTSFPNRIPLLAVVALIGCVGWMPVSSQDQLPADNESVANKNAAEILYGVLDAQVRKFRFVVELDESGETPSGTLRSLDEGDRVFSLSEIVKADGKLRFTLPATKAVYEGVLDDDGGMVRGKWFQGGGDISLDFEVVGQVPTRKIKEIWQGTINAVIQKIEVEFIVLDDGEMFFDSVSQKAGGFTVTREEKEDGEIVFRVPAVAGVFTGRYSDDEPPVLNGKWRQGLVGFALSLAQKDLGAPATAAIETVESRRPQMPTKPYSYRVEKVQFKGPHEDVTLAGTLTIPSKGARAAVVLVSGSGPQDRDETIFGHKPFWVIADHFARHGIATLRYDDRGVGESTGDFSTATSLDFAKDSESALNYLSTRDELQSVVLGLCGHSEGGLLAPLVAARNNRVGFIVLLAAPGVNGEKIILSQSPLLMRAQGVDEATLQKQSKVQEVVLGMIRDSAPDDPEFLDRRFREIFGDEVPESELAALIETAKANVEQKSTAWLRTFLTLEPAEALVNVECPVLALNGGKDLQVEATLNLPKIKAALKEGGNENVETVLYPGLNHLFQQCDSGSVAEYGIIEETFNIVPLQKMTEWILKLPE